MSYIIKYLAFIVMAGVLACCGSGKDPNNEEDKCNNAALELYCKYADNDNLTVAYLGDFDLKGEKIDAVMLQANDDEEWLRLRQDLGLVMESDSCEKAIDLSACSKSDKVVSVGIGIEADFLTALGLDSLTTRDQITEEQIHLFSENVAMQLRNILNNFGKSDSLMPATAIIVGDDPVKYDSTSTNYDDYINTVALTIATGIIDEYFKQLDSINEIEKTEPYQKAMEGSDNMMTNTILHGQSDYITAADHTNRTLWFFFYDNQEECNNIITHISEDMIIK